MAKKAKKYSVLFLVMAISVASLFFTPVFAWCLNKLATNVVVNSSIIGSYFEQGNGTEDTPYVIARPIQLYYFAWLQNLGYFDGDNNLSTTSDKKYYFTLGSNIDMSGNTEYAHLPPIGTAEYPFKGVFDGKYHYAPTDSNGNPVQDKFDPNNTIEGTYHVISNVTISNTDLSHIPENGDEGMQYVGLFGVIGSISDTTVKGEVKNFALDGITVETEEPLDDKTIIGIVAGYCNGVVSGVGVSNCTLSIANGLSPVELPIRTSNPDTGVVTTRTGTPETLSFSLIGFSDTAYDAFNISPLSGGNEFGSSLEMHSLFNRVMAARDSNSAVYSKYYTHKTITIDEDDNVTVVQTGENTYNGNVNSRYFRLTNTEILNEDDEVVESYAIAKRYSDSNYSSTNNQYMYVTGSLSIEYPQIITTIRRVRYDAYRIGDGNGNYLVGSTNSISNTRNSENASAWRYIDDNGGVLLAIQINEVAYYLYNNNGTLSMSSTNSTVWTINNDRITNGGYYLCYLDGAWTLLAETTYYSIDDNNNHYLNLTNGNIVSGATSTTRWHLSNNKIYTYVNNVKTYLYNNNNVLDITTNSNTATQWTISNGQISNNGYNICYLDGTWILLAETTYYSIDDGNGTYLNFLNGNAVAGATSTTRWHISNGKIYIYVNNVKTYLCNNSGVVGFSTNSATATIWTVGVNSITNGEYYLCYNDNEWLLAKELGYYSINNGSGVYLNLNGNNLTSGTSSNATRWFIVNDKLYAYNNGVETYLYNNSGYLTTTTNISNASVWDIENNNVKNGDYYLTYQNRWIVTSELDYYLIDDGGGHYLNLTTSGFETGTSATAMGWHFTTGVNGEKIYTYVNGVKTYLLNDSGVFSTTTNQALATEWVVGANSISNDVYNLVYQNGWQLTNESNYYLISDGNGHYLNLTTNGFEVGTSSTATAWHFSNGQTGGKIYTYINGDRKYLLNDNGELSSTLNENTASLWGVSNGQITNNSYYLTYCNIWLLDCEVDYYKISDGNGNYLNLTSSGFSVGTSLNSTIWHFTNSSSGKIYTFINGVATYLYNNSGTLATTTDTNSATVWAITKDTINSIFNISNSGYYLRNDNGWGLTNSDLYYTISNNNGSYLNLNASTGLTAIGNSNNATIWKISSGVNGNVISTKVNGVTYYLNFENGNMKPNTINNGTNWVVTNNQISYTQSDRTYYMFCDGTCWTLVLSSLNSYYIIGDGNGNYMDCSSGSISNTTVRSYATKWTFSNGDSGGTISTNINGTNYNLYRSSSTLTLSANNSTAWTYSTSNNRLYYRSSGWFSSSYYIRYYNNGWTSLTTSATSVNGIDNISSSSKVAVTAVNNAQPDLVALYDSGTFNFNNTITAGTFNLTINTNNNLYNLIVNMPYTAYNLTVNHTDFSYNLDADMTSYYYDLDLQIDDTTTVWQYTDVDENGTQQIETAPTYIPLTLNANGTVSNKNTGYIVSGGNYDYVTAGSYPGDIRVSYYTISGNLTAALNGSSSYSSSRLEVVTRTYLSNGYCRISDEYNSSNSSINSTLSSTFPNKIAVANLGLDKYTDSREQLHDTLSNSSNIYGLHFMDALINQNKTVTIQKAIINGNEYSNYIMPQDCIDFNLSVKGQLNFFAGTYFPGNTTFFSLHHITRLNNVITSISEISKIYGDPTNNSKSYIYQYVGQGQPSLPSGYILMFDTSWITTPTMVENAMYYFEIPVNAGEYALGSVSGADGAYLIYLDIGASLRSLSDGTTLETSIKGMDFVTANSITSANIATTLTAITANTNSIVVIVVKNRFHGTINYVRTTYVQNNQTKDRVTYTISDASSEDYVKWTRESNDTDVVLRTGS